MPSYSGEPYRGLAYGEAPAAAAITVAAAGAATCELSAVAVGKGLPYGDSTVAVTAAGAGSSIQPSVGEADIAVAASGDGASILARISFAITAEIPVGVGLPITIGLESSVSTVSVPIVLGSRPVTATLPIRITQPLAISTAVSLPIAIYGDLTGRVLEDRDSTTSSSWVSVGWQPVVKLGDDYTNISGLVIGALEIDTEEMASPVARFALLPADGEIDPLGYVGKRVEIEMRRYVGEFPDQTALRFTGIVSTPTWNADQRILTIEATGDMQAKFDRMTKDEIDTVLAGVAPRFSRHVFGDPASMSGWDYAEALISTTDAVLWMDTSGTLQATSTLPAEEVDYTFDNTTILTGSLAESPEWPSRQAMLNKVELQVEYRHKRKRQRNINVKFESEYLKTPSYYISGYLGGWPLPQRSQVESAANGGGWSVIGEIEYDDVWDSDVYPTYSDTGSSMMMGWSNNTAITKEFCIGATWKAGRRWLQTVTETATIVVNASESQQVVGVLADRETYGIEDPADDETWETSTEYTDFAGGAIIMLNAVDKKVELDTLRAEFEEAQEVAIAKARGDILRGHRGTSVTFQTPYAPGIALLSTVAIDTTYLQCQGRVRRIVDRWDLDTGDCLSTITLALYRHNGDGLTEDTEIAPVEEAADPDETSPVTRVTMDMYIGGSETRPPWSTVKDESGYFVNLPFDETWGSATVLGQWQRNPNNPLVKLRTYEEGMRIKYPDIDAEYTDPQNAAATATIEVAVPEDPLVIVSG